VLADPRLRSFVLAHTRLKAAPYVPELRLHLAEDVTILWARAAEELGPLGDEPPFWATAWAGGQALARYLLDHPGIVEERSLLDLASGSGLVAIAASLAGARTVRANDIDPLSIAALQENLAANGAEVAIVHADLLDGPPAEDDVVVAGDICYHQDMTERMLAWLRSCHDAGSTVLMGDPGRAFLPTAGLRELARYEISGDPTLENADVNSAAVYTFA
jgi:predicted nicotinamide N-methyase